MPNCEVCEGYIAKRKKLDLKRTDLDLDTEILVCSKCYEICVNLSYPQYDPVTRMWSSPPKYDCARYKNNSQFATNQKARRLESNRQKASMIAATTKNPKLFPQVPTTPLK